MIEEENENVQRINGTDVDAQCRFLLNTSEHWMVVQ